MVSPNKRQMRSLNTTELFNSKDNWFKIPQPLNHQHTINVGVKNIWDSGCPTMEKNIYVCQNSGDMCIQVSEILTLGSNFHEFLTNNQQMDAAGPDGHTIWSSPPLSQTLPPPKKKIKRCLKKIATRLLCMQRKTDGPWSTIFYSFLFLFNHFWLFFMEAILEKI